MPTIPSKPLSALSRRAILPLALAASVVIAGCAPVMAQEAYPPIPPLRSEMPPPAPPGERWVWQPGHWQWASREYAWIPGEWVERPYPHLQWVHGHWAWRRFEGWIWIPGYWR